MTIKECGTQFDPVYRDGNQESNWLSSLTNTTHYINNQFSNQTYIRIYPLYHIALQLTNCIHYILVPTHIEHYYLIKCWD